MTQIDDKALEAAVLAHDKEEAAMRGEPDPWADERPDDEFSDRKEAMAEAIRAYLTASDAEREPVEASDVRELVERLTDAANDPETLTGTSAIFRQASRLLTEQAAEIERLREARHFWKTEYLNASADAAKFANDLVRAEARLAEALKALDETDRILRDIERHETTRVVDAQDRISIALRVREGGKVDG